jgi:hypothetical protein
MAFVLMPVLVLKPRKFVILWTVGSLLFLCRYSPARPFYSILFWREFDVNGSFAALQGPVPYIKHLLSPTRVPFTTAYFGSLAATLYFSIGVNIHLFVLY